MSISFMFFMEKAKTVWRASSIHEASPWDSELWFLGSCHIPKDPTDRKALYYKPWPTTH